MDFLRLNNIVSDLKLTTKFMIAVSTILIILTVIDVKFSMKNQEKIVLDDIKKWTFLLAENVRVSMNTLMREDKMDIRFAMFDSMSKELKGLKDIRIIRGKKVNEIFKEINEKELIPREEKAINRFLNEISELEEELEDATDVDERDDLKEEIESLKMDIERAERKIKKARKEKVIDEREKPKDRYDLQVLKSGEPLYLIEGDNARVLIPYKAQKKGCSETSGCHKYAKEGDVLGAVNLAFSIDDVNREIGNNNLIVVGMGVLKLALILVAIVFILAISVIKPINGVSDMLKVIASGRGDLTHRLDVTTKDEVGTLSKWFNSFVEGMQELVKDIFSAYGNIALISNDIKHSSDSIKESAHIQMQAIDDTSSSIQEMNSSIQSVAHDAEEQMKSTEDASSAILEMLSSNSEVAENTEQLSESVDRTSSSMTEIVATLKEVSTHVDDLFMKTEEVVSATTEINSAVIEVSNHAKQKAVLAEKVREDATNIGMGAVNKTTESMEKIRDEVAATADVINRLEERSGEIGRIVGVIENVTETTNLLSLNAAIIAAQAGEHGKGFAVVANEVKTLAKKTASSTNEITDLINLVRDEVSAAKNSMDNSSQSVEEGFKVSLEARKALEKITGSAEESLNMARKVELATSEQTKVLSKVTEAVQNINDMVEEIKKATDEQKISSEEILRSTEDMRDNTEVVRRSTLEQSRESDHIQKVITDISEKMQTIARATKEQKHASQVIVETVETVRDEVEKNVKLSADMEKSVFDLDKEKTNLQDKVESFKV